MSDQQPPPSKQRFQAKIHQDLDRKLRYSDWNSSASEAHGLLCGLACLGVRNEQLVDKSWLFRVSKPDEIDLLEGLYSLILQDLKAGEFSFNPLLLDEPNNHMNQLESFTDWCSGFIQGFLHNDEYSLSTTPSVVRESFDDIMKISRIGNLNNSDVADETTVRQLVEIEEYLRVATQVIFEELNPPAASQSPPHSKENGDDQQR